MPPSKTFWVISGNEPKKKSKHIFKLKASAENPAKKAYFRQNFKQNSSPIYVILYDLSCVHWSSTASGVV